MSHGSPQDAGIAWDGEECNTTLRVNHDGVTAVMRCILWSDHIHYGDAHMDKDGIEWLSGKQVKK